MTAILSDRLYVPRGAARPEHFRAYRHWVTDGLTKEKYEVETYEELADGYAFPRGDLAKMREQFPELTILDQRVSMPYRYPLKMTKRLRPYQKAAVREWLGYGYGQIEAPPRTGKTVMMTALTVLLKQRAIMFAHVEDLCHQFEETVRAFTNINELEERYNIKLCGVLDEWTDVFPIITFTTYQCFIMSDKGREVLRQHRDSFGLVMCDEVHRATTEHFSGVLGSFTAAYRCGVTATPDRKSGIDAVAKDVIGPVVTFTEGEQLPVHWTWNYTERDVPTFSNWAVMWNRLVRDKVRTKRIARKIVEDVEAGHYVLVTTERLSHLDALQDAIQTIDPDITVGLLSGKTRDREAFRAKAKRGDYQVVIAMNRIVELGYNVPRWSCFHNTLPMADPHNWYQRVSRIRTPMEPAFKGDDWVKPQPVARVWVDQGHPAVYAYRNIVNKKMVSLGFTCLTQEPTPKKRRRVGIVTYEEIDEPEASR